jgi:hypothetical protein
MSNNKGRHCRFCDQNVRNPCIHISQRKFCKSQPVDGLVGEIVYGYYESREGNTLIEYGVGPVQIEPGYRIDNDNLITSLNGIDTQIRLSSCP